MSIFDVAIRLCAEGWLKEGPMTEDATTPPTEQVIEIDEDGRVHHPEQATVPRADYDALAARLEEARAELKARYQQTKRPAPMDDDATTYVPTQVEIDRLEKAAWDTNTDQVLVYIRDQRDALAADRDQLQAENRELTRAVQGNALAASQALAEKANLYTLAQNLQKQLLEWQALAVKYRDELDRMQKI